MSICHTIWEENNMKCFLFSQSYNYINFSRIFNFMKNSRKCYYNYIGNYTCFKFPCFNLKLVPIVLIFGYPSHNIVLHSFYTFQISYKLLSWYQTRNMVGKIQTIETLYLILPYWSQSCRHEIPGKKISIKN